MISHVLIVPSLCVVQETALCLPLQAGLGRPQLLREIREETLQTPEGESH